MRRRRLSCGGSRTATLASVRDGAQPYVMLRVCMLPRCTLHRRPLRAAERTQSGCAQGMRAPSAPGRWRLRGGAWAGLAICARDMRSTGQASASAACRLGEEERAENPRQGDRGVSRRCSFGCHWVRPSYSRVRVCALPTNLPTDGYPVPPGPVSVRAGSRIYLSIYLSSHCTWLFYLAHNPQTKVYRRF